MLVFVLSGDIRSVHFGNYVSVVLSFVVVIDVHSVSCVIREHTRDLFVSRPPATASES